MTAPDDIQLPRPKPKPRNTDWEAAHRDFRTGKYTQRELAGKYKVSHVAVGNKIRAEGWKQDLTDAIRQETNARLTADLVDGEVTRTYQQVTGIVGVSAEANVRIILGHRFRLSELAGAVDQAKAKLLELGDLVSDIKEAATFVQAVGNLANATKTLLEQERKAHNLDDAPPDDEKTAHAVKVKFV